MKTKDEAALFSSQQDERELPPLPEPLHPASAIGNGYTADQMREYALLARAALPARQEPNVNEIVESWLRKELGGVDADNVTKTEFAIFVRLAKHVLANPAASKPEAESDEYYRCSNPNCRAEHPVDPKGHCPACVDETGCGWSCVPCTGKAKLTKEWWMSKVALEGDEPIIAGKPTPQGSIPTPQREVVAWMVVRNSGSIMGFRGTLEEAENYATNQGDAKIIPLIRADAADVPKREVSQYLWIAIGQLIFYAKRYRENYLLDEIDEPELCIDKHQHADILSFSNALDEAADMYIRADAADVTKRETVHWLIPDSSCTADKMYGEKYGGIPLCRCQGEGSES